MYAADFHVCTGCTHARLYLLSFTLSSFEASLIVLAKLKHRRQPNHRQLVRLSPCPGALTYRPWFSVRRIFTSPSLQWRATCRLWSKIMQSRANPRYAEVRGCTDKILLCARPVILCPTRHRNAYHPRHFTPSSPAFGAHLKTAVGLLREPQDQLLYDRFEIHHHPSCCWVTGS